MPVLERIYLSPPHMGGGELDLVKEAFATNWIAPVGPHVDAFEREFAAVTGAGHAAAVSSGTAALHLALRLLGICRGDRVFASAFTFVASVNPILYEGGEPVLIDSERESWNMDPALLEEALRDAAAGGRLPKAVIVAHLYGQPANIDAILAACAPYSVPVIEDAAEALGAQYYGLDGRWKSQDGAGRTPGTFGIAGIFSFNGNKIITTSGGGMLISDHCAFADKARFLATQARDPAPHYQHSELGYNYRMSNVLAAIGRGQLRVLAGRVEARRRNFAAYREALGGLPGVDFMPEPSWCRSTRWLTCMTVDPSESGASRDVILRALEEQNIESRPLWKPMHLQPLFKNTKIYGGGVSKLLFENGLCLPSGSSLPDLHRLRVCEIVHKCFPH